MNNFAIVYLECRKIYVSRRNTVVLFYVTDAKYQVSLKLFHWFQGRNFLKGCFSIYGHGGHLGHVTRIMLSNFYFNNGFGGEEV